MKNVILTLAILLAMSCSVFAQDTATAPPVVTWGGGNNSAGLETATPVKAMSFRSDGFSFRDFRKMGLRLRDVRQAIGELQAEGVITEDMTKAEVSAEVTNRLMQTHARAFQDPQLDWDSFLAFIERLIPLIMTLISLFS